MGEGLVEAGHLLYNDHLALLHGVKHMASSPALEEQAGVIGRSLAVKCLCIMCLWRLFRSPQAMANMC